MSETNSTIEVTVKFKYNVADYQDIQTFLNTFNLWLKSQLTYSGHVEAPQYEVVGITKDTD